MYGFYAPAYKVNYGTEKRLLLSFDILATFKSNILSRLKL